jgi:hypothetical protein
MGDKASALGLRFASTNWTLHKTYHQMWTKKMSAMEIWMLKPEHKAEGRA